MITGRADDIRIVNGTNIAPEVLRDALDDIGVLPRLHHFKHDTDGARPNDYLVYLELQDTLEEAEREALAKMWRPALLQALIAQPSVADLSADPLVLHLWVRSRGTEEFEGDDQRAKKSYVPRRMKPASVATPAEVLIP